MSDNENLDEKSENILNLWHDSSWIGSYRGIKSFQTFLKTDKNIDISTRDLTKILKNDRLYLMHLKPKAKIQRRHYVLNYYGELFQSDLGFMFQYEEFHYFLLVIDCYSLKIYTKCLKTKSSEEVLKAFKEIKDKFNIDISKLEVDQGTEFVQVAKYCKQEKIIFKYKYGQNKANFAEWAIMVIKRRLYKMLRGSLSQDWPTYISQVVNDHNNTPQKKLGFLKPNDIKTIYDSAKVDEARKLHNINVSNILSFQKQEEHQVAYLDNKEALKVNDYVYIDFKKSLFGKSFDVQVRISFFFNLICIYKQS